MLPSLENRTLTLGSPSALSCDPGRSQPWGGHSRPQPRPQPSSTQLERQGDRSECWDVGVNIADKQQLASGWWYQPPALTGGGAAAASARMDSNPSSRTQAPATVGTRATPPVSEFGAGGHSPRMGTSGQEGVRRCPPPGTGAGTDLGLASLLLMGLGPDRRGNEAIQATGLQGVGGGFLSSQFAGV